MKLSTAMALGNVVKKPNSKVWLREEVDGICGCAIGGALLASGVTMEEYKAQEDQISQETRNESPQGYIVLADCVHSRWPWLTAQTLTTISGMYHEVVRGKIPLEMLIDFVSKIEPQETNKQNSADAVQDQRTLVA